MSEEKKVFEVTKVAEDKKVVDPFIAGFYESMAKTNIEKITGEIMADLSEDSDDSDDFDVESGDEDSEDRPWRPSHTDSRLEGGVNRAKLKFTKINTATSRVSVRNKNRVRERGCKTNLKQIRSVTQGFVLPRFGSRKPTPR
jgi:uncharacterized protein (DUF2147 family)